MVSDEVIDIEWTFIRSQLPSKVRDVKRRVDRQVRSGVFHVLCQQAMPVGVSAIPPCGRDAQKNDPRRYIGRSRRGLTTRIHVSVNDAGLPLRTHLIPGQAHDWPAPLCCCEGCNPVRRSWQTRHTMPIGSAS